MTLDGRQYHIKGRLIAFVGDTPAVNLVGGFKEGVGMAMRKCRQCMATFDQIQTKVSSFLCADRYSKLQWLIFCFILV